MSVTIENDGVTRVLPDCRNAIRRGPEAIDCEVNHPKYGWIPTTVLMGEDPDLYQHVMDTTEVADNDGEDIEFAIMENADGIA